MAMMKFEKDSIDASLLSFKMELGEDDFWFYDMLKAVKEEYVDQGVKITDILIREGKPVQLAIIKAYIPLILDNKPDAPYVIPSRQQIKSVMQTLSGMEADDFEKKDTIDFSFSVKGLGIFRVNYSTEIEGVTAAIRYLTFELPSFEDVGYPAFYKDYVKSFIKDLTIEIKGRKYSASTINTGGLILHTGATGSGKTTSIASEIAYLAENSTGAIITYEDPIEYRYIATKAPVKQYGIGEQIATSPDAVVSEEIKKHLLRNNPSVALIGEARENTEIKMTVEIASRGHLIFSTMHSQNVSEALSTLAYVCADSPYMLASSIRAIVAHKLVYSRKGKIVPLFEIFVPDEIMKNNILKGEYKKIFQQFYKENRNDQYGITFARSLEQRVSQGLLQPDEAEDIIRSNPVIFNSSYNL